MTFGIPVGVPPGNHIDHNIAKRNRLKDKKERMVTLVTLCNKKASSVCGDRDYHYFNKKETKGERVKYVAPFEKN